jgi:hypothetical protein
MVLLIVSDMTDNNETTLDDLDAQLQAVSADAAASAASLESAADELVADISAEPATESDAPDNEIVPASPADLLPTGDANLSDDSDAQALLGDDVEISSDEAAVLLPSGDTSGDSADTDDTAESQSADGDNSADADEVGPDGEDVEPPVVDDPNKRPGKWFVVHTLSGYEK